ncbi:GCN5-related N-acetyltransferase [Kribbella flavida DSM 17836]|uniref:GCN5-related N-acetyltransferase n=1 Tax=Kribbella flavida (strain DSM 17836 / JCM 10339 / NBRC 14399) TaxID=479435 RepID=D2PZM3_KRIFD|nr:GNAT family N-acetyltransferase [Kribbella flavida]ADB35589.1 GCN5-related N-acetyltransferase [Kribbella flavida DSM 17836]
MITQATDADFTTVVDVLTEAFQDDPLVGWLFPDAAERAHLQARFYRSQLADPCVEAYLIDGEAGAALWRTTSSEATPSGDGSEPDLEAAFGPAGARLRALGAALAVRHPVAPYLYLSCMGVTAGRRGTGLGSALLQHRLDEAGDVTAYLEASSPGSRALYLRHGFHDFGAPVQVADGPLLWPMARLPQKKEINR